MGYEILTEREKQVVEAILAFRKRNRGQYPTKSQIKETLKLKHQSSISNLFRSLEKKEAVESLKGSRSGYVLAPEFIEGQSFSATRVINIEGVVAAGVLTEAINERESLELPSSMLNGQKEYFGLYVKGDSMVGDHIISGDIVVLERGEVFNDGEIVVAMSDGDATLKRIYQKPDHIELRASNPTYAPIKIKDDPSFKVLGKLKTVIRDRD